MVNTRPPMNAKELKDELEDAQQMLTNARMKMLNESPDIELARIEDARLAYEAANANRLALRQEYADMRRDVEELRQAVRSLDGAERREASHELARLEAELVDLRQQRDDAATEAQRLLRVFNADTRVGPNRTADVRQIEQRVNRLTQEIARLQRQQPHTIRRRSWRDLIERKR